MNNIVIPGELKIMLSGYGNMTTNIVSIIKDILVISKILTLLVKEKVLNFAKHLNIPIICDFNNWQIVTYIFSYRRKIIIKSIWR